MPAAQVAPGARSRAQEHRVRVHRGLEKLVVRLGAVVDVLEQKEHLNVAHAHAQPQQQVNMRRRAHKKHIREAQIALKRKHEDVQHDPQ